MDFFMNNDYEELDYDDAELDLPVPSSSASASVVSAVSVEITEQKPIVKKEENISNKIVETTEKKSTVTKKENVAKIISIEQAERIAAEIRQIQAMQKIVNEKYNNKENRSTKSPSPDADARSVFVNNVEYSASKNAFTHHFSKCGDVVRVTILTDKHTGRPKGHAYVEFDDEESMKKALALNGSVFCGRKLMVAPKRANKPGFKLVNNNRAYGSRSGFRTNNRRYTPY